MFSESRFPRCGSIFCALRKALCWCALVACLGLLAVRPAQSQEYYGIQIQDDNVAFLLDVSGSMENKDEGIAASKPMSAALNQAGKKLGKTLGGIGRKLGQRAKSETTKLGSARRELIRALESLPGEARFTIITFGSEVKEWPGGYREVGGVARRAAQVFVADLEAGGGTPMNEAIGAGYGLEGVDALFLVSDGRPTDAAGPAILEGLEALDGGRGIVINTIGIGPDQDEELLCKLAEQTGGFYVNDGEVACQGSR